MRIEPYEPHHKAAWDEFVAKSKNGTFLFYRDYMDYHADRFLDQSLLVYDQRERLVAMLPANQKGTELISHGGLTYGGFISSERMKTPMMLEAFIALVEYGLARGLTGMRYKAIPHIYHLAPAEEDLYALLIAGASLTTRSVLAASRARHRLPYQKRRVRGAAKARKNSLLVRASEDLPTYWTLLQGTLRRAHGAEPVHSLAEIQLLQDRFPGNIKLFACFEGETMRAGVLVFETREVARSQYIAADEVGKSYGALDLLFEVLQDEIYCDKPYFDFGTSERPGTPFLNLGLIDQKEGFGARAIVQDHYHLLFTAKALKNLTEAI